MMSLSANLKQKQLLCGFIPSKSFLQVSLCHIVYHYPRALPPVTHGSAFQAPECLREACDVDTYPLAYCLPGRGLSLGHISEGDAPGYS